MYTTENKYTREYFIAKFEAISEHNFGKGSIDNHCVLYHCGVVMEKDEYKITEEAKALAHLITFGSTTKLFLVNDEPNDTAKNNILNKLKEHGSREISKDTIEDTST